jgi:hypothetical protein
VTIPVGEPVGEEIRDPQADRGEDRLRLAARVAMRQKLAVVALAQREALTAFILVARAEDHEPVARAFGGPAELGGKLLERHRSHWA